jgi:hypothetical protein
MQRSVNKIRFTKKFYGVSFLKKTGYMYDTSMVEIMCQSFPYFGKIDDFNSIGVQWPSPAQGGGAPS